MYIYIYIHTYIHIYIYISPPLTPQERCRRPDTRTAREGKPEHEQALICLYNKYGFDMSRGQPFHRKMATNLLEGG